MRATTNGAICAGTRPTVTSGVPICALFSAMAQSRDGDEADAAAHGRALDQRDHRLRQRRRPSPAARRSGGWMRRSASSLPPRAASEPSMPLRSPPAQKLPPAPISTTTRMPASSRASLEGLRQLAHHRRRQRVARLGPVQRDLQHGPVAVDDQRFMRHGRSAFSLSPLAGRANSYLFRLPGRMPMCLQMMPSMTSSAPPPMEPSRVSR